MTDTANKITNVDNGIGLLLNDLTKLLASWGAIPQRTAAMIKQFPKKKITQPQVAIDDKNPCMLQDGRLVGSITKSMARRYWSLGDDRVFPTKDVLVRLGRFFFLDLYKTTALVLKGQWENMFLTHMGWPDRWRHRNKGQVHILGDWEAAKRCKTRFDPDTESLYTILASEGMFDDHCGYDQQKFDALVQKMILKDLHIRSIYSPEMNAFIAEVEEVQGQGGLLSGLTPEQDRAYWIAESSWIELQKQLGEILMLIEDVRLKNANTNAKWLAIFGSVFSEFEEFSFRDVALQRRIDLKIAAPELTPDQLDEQVAAKEADEEDELEMLRLQVSLGLSVRPPGGLGKTVDEKEIAKYLRRCKDVLVKIHLLIYPDSICHHPKFDHLTPAQRERLDELEIMAIKWNRMMRIRRDELNWDPSTLAYEHRLL